MKTSAGKRCSVVAGDVFFDEPSRVAVKGRAPLERLEDNPRWDNKSTPSKKGPELNPDPPSYEATASALGR